MLHFMAKGCTLPPKVRNKALCLSSPLLFSAVWKEALASAAGQDEVKKACRQKGRRQPSPSAGDVIVYLENPMGSAKVKSELRS